MEVLPCSGVQYVGESDCAQQNSGTAFVYDGESNGLEHGKQVQIANGRADDSLPNAEGSQKERHSEAPGGMLDESSVSRERRSGASFSDCIVESHKPSCGSCDLADVDLNVQSCCKETYAVSENSHLIVDTFESDPSNSRDGDSSFSEPNWLEDDESLALWVKWRGIWQAGIRCVRADWPLSTLRAKPTHDRKKYFVVFFPHTRNYSWADTLLVQPIDEYPQPIAYRTHKIGLKMVKDLSVPRRFIMQKLAVSMLNIVDQFHTEALIDTARDVMVWKEFAMEASHCSGYSDLGRMLLKLQNMILQKYINSDWLQHSFQSWAHQCQAAHSAESIELLKEELSDSILWDGVKSLGEASVQSTLGSGWKTWKHEVMKWFSTSHPICSGGDVEQRSSPSPSTLSPEVSRKRPKLEVRRAEAHASLVETTSPLETTTVEIDSEFFNNQDSVNGVTLVPELLKEEDLRGETAPVESSCIFADRWDEIIVEAGNSELSKTKDAETTPVSQLVAEKTINTGNKNRQCIAFVESKGRQCVRWANDGDVYCCVHLGSRFTGSSTRAEASPVHSAMCEGTTVLGSRCKHRSLPGSSFCKKHGPRTDAEKNSIAQENTLKRKHDEVVPGSETTYSKDMVLVGQFELPVRVEPISGMDGDAVNGEKNLVQKLENPSHEFSGTEIPHCIGSSQAGNGVSCIDSPKRYSLYCDQHVPSWLKRARNGKSRIISKDVFIDLLKDCGSMKQKLHLHQACELFYKLFKSILSLRNPVPMEVQLQWALSEVSKDHSVGKFLLRLAYAEKERIRRLWGFTAEENVHVSSSSIEEPTVLPLAIDGSKDDDNSIRCKICSKEFVDDQELGNHWMDHHKKEAQWFFRGYACAICLDSFTNKKGLETHVQERHHVQFVEQCMLLQCIPCKSHFGNNDQLWSHVLTVHSSELRQSTTGQHHNVSMSEEKEDTVEKLELGNMPCTANNTESSGGIRKFICRFCGLKFDLLPDLGRHHQAAHMGPNALTSRPPKKGIRYYAYKLKSGRLSRPRFKKGLGATYRIRKRASASMKTRIQASKLLSTEVLTVQPPVPEAANLGRLPESQCSDVAKILYSEVQKTKPRPNNFDILAIARFVCCKVSLKASLEGKYGVLPERLYLKAAKLCSENNIQVEWHREGFICPRGCKCFKDLTLLSPLMPLSSGLVRKQPGNSSCHVNNEWEVDECHYIINIDDLREGPKRKTSVLCKDISFGKESMPVCCVAEEYLLDSLRLTSDGSSDKISKALMPWESFTYITRPFFHQSHIPDIESLHLGCACLHSVCHPEACDHVYLFENDYEEAKDIYGEPMLGRFPYDDKGRIILEEGYLVYECNQMCSCNETCTNRVLQNGIRVKLEVFKTENKGWAVRAGEPILRGTFVCEYIGEVLDVEEANKRRASYGGEGCSYLYKIDARANDMSRLIEGEVQYIIDATKFGNISRFINHSCLPNLVSYQVLVDSMDSQRARIGLYASRDIAVGEELTYNYHYELLPGDGCPCYCGAPKCRGRLY